MYPRIPWQLVADLLGSAERTWEPPSARGNRPEHLGTAQSTWEPPSALGNRPEHLGTADLRRGKAHPSSDEVKNEWICGPNIHCIITLSRKPEADASLHMKLVSCLSEEPTAAVPDTSEVQPDYTPPRGGN